MCGRGTTVLPAVSTRSAPSHSNYRDYILNVCSNDNNYQVSRYLMGTSAAQQCVKCVNALDSLASKVCASS